jgi:hypothetical protein
MAPKRRVAVTETQSALDLCGADGRVSWESQDSRDRRCDGRALAERGASQFWPVQVARLLFDEAAKPWRGKRAEGPMKR